MYSGNNNKNCATGSRTTFFAYISTLQTLWPRAKTKLTPKSARNSLPDSQRSQQMAHTPPQLQLILSFIRNTFIRM